MRATNSVDGEMIYPSSEFKRRFNVFYGNLSVVAREYYGLYV